MALIAQSTQDAPTPTRVAQFHADMMLALINSGSTVASAAEHLAKYMMAFGASSVNEAHLALLTEGVQ